MHSRTQSAHSASVPVAQLIADNTDADVALFTERQTALDAARDEHIAAAKSQFDLEADSLTKAADVKQLALDASNADIEARRAAVR
jgi:hypothetical protein